MNEIEGLGSFYLGKPSDVEGKKRGDGYVLYGSKDIDVTLATLAFAPHWQDAAGQLTPAY
ncbi:MAG: hypothetical protein M3Q31_11765 [Actinomycetota bacterium]|nr:hypothetical protein [Actinomycetota bacterium]